MPDLWKGVVWEKNPNLFYIGMHEQIYSFPQFAAQAWFVRDVILGKIKVPSWEEMKADHERYQKKCDEIDDLTKFIKFQGDYITD